MSNPKNDLLIKNLVEFGFSDKEAKIYIALLEAEVATANELSKATGINRSSTYVVLEGLKTKGFVGVSNDKKVQGYVAVSPDIILETLENTIKKQNILRDKIKDIIPDLKELDKSNKKAPIVRVFEGKAGLREVYFDVFNTDVNEFRVCEDLENIVKLIPDFIEYDYEQRKGKKIELYTIGPDGPANDLCFSAEKDPWVHNVVIPRKKYKFPVDITIYGDRIAIASPKDFTGIIIEHKEIAESLKQIFNLAWKEASRMNVSQH